MYCYLTLMRSFNWFRKFKFLHILVLILQHTVWLLLVYVPSCEAVEHHLLKISEGNLHTHGQAEPEEKRNNQNTKIIYKDIGHDKVLIVRFRI